MSNDMRKIALPAGFEEDTSKFSIKSDESKAWTANYWLVMSIEDCKIDAPSETATAKVWSKWHFHEPKFLDLISSGERELEGKGIDCSTEEGRDATAARLATGNMLKDCCLVDTGSTAFPVNRKSVFQNTIGSVEDLGLGWVPFNIKAGVLSTQVVFMATVSVNVHLRRT